uniref:Uncharacterized protein n=1 Tax=Picea sitchensis TaxID=3332 RepID=A9NSL0_PICSI|nr:unknown [Picea sitchensis]
MSCSGPLIRFCDPRKRRLLFSSDLWYILYLNDIVDIGFVEVILFWSRARVCCIWYTRFSFFIIKAFRK